MDSRITASNFRNSKCRNEVNIEMGACSYQKSKVERSVSAKHDLGITVLYGEEVLKSQFQAMTGEEVAE